MCNPAPKQLEFNLRNHRWFRPVGTVKHFDGAKSLTLRSPHAKKDVWIVNMQGSDQ